MQKRLLITGGNGGIAMACCEEFQSQGWEVLAPSRLELDVSDSESVEAFMRSCAPVDLLVCAAGVTEDSLLGRMGEASWDNVLDVNLKGAFRCARAVSAQMLRRRAGHVIFVSSHSAFTPPIGQANYAAAKAGLVAMGKSLAQEWGSRSVRVNVITPGFLETKMTEGLSAEVRQSVLDAHTLGAFNTAKNVAQFVHFLEQTMVHTSGQVFHLDSRVL
ncbi:MAG: SDR family NAD(P)-dependent oxidoreductase [Rubritalea sp.]|uniref:SDR family NAD(P)-dependent oxidoreductase n=1 Tax=Rubritalea sp. TaxID=2109375 RepID=UPI003242A4E9